METVVTHRNRLILSCSPPFYNFARIFANVGGGGEGEGREHEALCEMAVASMPLTASPRFPASSLSATRSLFSRDILFYESRASSYQPLTSCARVITPDAGNVCYLPAAGAARGKQNQPDCLRFGLVWSV